MQNVAVNEDLRIRRTRKMLQQALLELTVEKGYDAVTVRDISERAMVNRSTFYRHYLDKHDLLDQYTNEVSALTSQEDFIAEKLGQTAESSPSGLVNLLRHVQTFAEFYRVMLGQKGCAQFTERFRQSSINRFRQLLAYTQVDTDPHAPPLEMRLNYISSAGVGAILWWLENDQPCSAEQLAGWIGQLSSSNAGLPF